MLDFSPLLHCAVLVSQMEVAAGLVAAEQVASTAVEAGVAYGIAKPTPPLTATFTRISSEAFLPRIHHSLTVINGRAYIFGGENEKGELAGDEVHIIALPLKGVGNVGKPDYSSLSYVLRMLFIGRALLIN